MARWIQRVNKDGSTYMEPADESARIRDGGVAGAAVHGDIQSFVSPIDGTVISDRKQLREHNKRHNVVNTQEFGTEHWERKAKERADLYEGRRSTQQVQRDREQIHEIIMRHERNGR